MTEEKMITITPEAKEHILQLRKNGGFDDNYALKVSVEGGGCSGLAYKLDFSDKMEEGDQLVQDQGIDIYVNIRSLLYLMGTELDYTGGLKGEGFYFRNPNASRTCACGESFSV